VPFVFLQLIFFSPFRQTLQSGEAFEVFDN
jgi:hypothetical protein